MKRATQNKILPSKTYWGSMIFIGFISLVTFLYRNIWQASVFVPLIIMIYFIGRYNQEKENPDMTG